jgi:AcrR family transcriptional regulator
MIGQSRTAAEHVPQGCAETAIGQRDARSRIVEATFEALVEHGYTGTSTREIAKRARVSKRELYAIFGSKQGILAAMIEGRAARMRSPLALPQVADREALEKTLVSFGATLVREVSHPAVTALFRLAVIEAERSPEVARALDEGGRKTTRNALVAFLERAAAQGLMGDGHPETVAAQFLALLWGDLQMSLLMRLAAPPAPAEIEQRARAAASAVLVLYPARSG